MSGSYEAMGVTTMLDLRLSDSRLWHYRAVVTRVIDGDTVEAHIDCGFGNYRVERLRLARVDAPEMRPRRGTPEQKEAERAVAAESKDRVIELVQGRECMIRTYKTGNFGRWIADVHLPDDAVSALGRVASDEPLKTVNEVLIEEKLAIQYGGKKPDNWEEYRNQPRPEEAGEA